MGVRWIYLSFPINPCPWRLGSNLAAIVAAVVAAAATAAATMVAEDTYMCADIEISSEASDTYELGCLDGCEGCLCDAMEESKLIN